MSILRKKNAYNNEIYKHRKIILDAKRYLKEARAGGKSEDVEMHENAIKESTEIIETLETSIKTLEEIERSTNKF